MGMYFENIPRAFSISDLRKMTGAHYTTIIYWIMKGKLTAYRCARATIIIPDEKFFEFLKCMEQKKEFRKRQSERAKMDYKRGKNVASFNMMVRKAIELEKKLRMMEMARVIRTARW